MNSIPSQPIKAQPVKLIHGKGYAKCSIEECTHVTLNFPGPVGRLTVPVILSGSRKGTGCWSWNGDIYEPTLRPSFKTEGIDRVTEQPYVCHTWVSDGEATFLDDTTHSLVRQIVPMLSVEM